VSVFGSKSDGRHIDLVILTRENEHEGSRCGPYRATDKDRSGAMYDQFAMQYLHDEVVEIFDRRSGATLATETVRAAVAACPDSLTENISKAPDF
jgi:hypothetical protein